MAKKENAEPRQEKKSNLGIIIGFIIVLLILLAVAFLVFFNGSALTAIQARTLVSVNLREGPGITYPVVGSLPAGTEVTVVGRNEDGSWLLVETGSGNAWMTGSSDYVEIDPESLSKLPVVEAPPPAYDPSNVKVNQVLNQIPLVVHHPDRFTCASHAGLNNHLPLEDGNVIGPHSADFVHVEMGNVLFEYSNGSFRLIRENPIARFDGGEKYLPLAKALEMFQTGEIVWNGSFGDWPGRGVPGCDESASP